MANSGRSSKPTSKSGSAPRRVPKSNATRGAIKSTAVTNTKDFHDWEAAGSPKTWTPSSHSDYKPSKGPR